MSNMSFYWLESFVPILSFNPNFLIDLNLLMWWVRYHLRKYSHSLICCLLNIYRHVPSNQKTFSDRIFYHKKPLHSTPNVMEFMRGSMEHLLMWYIFSPRWMRVGWICSLFSSCLYLYSLYYHLIIWYLEDK